MKVLVATARTQGARDNDYNWCIIEWELDASARYARGIGQTGPG
jgi:hypothetical protein